MASLKSLLKVYICQALLFALVLVCGTYIFVYLESPQKSVKMKSQISLASLEKDLIEKYNISKSVLDMYAKKRIYTENLQGGLSPPEAFRLSLSIAFTTGIGYFVPTTNKSKVFFLFFSCGAIITASCVLKTISDIVTLLIRLLICKLEKVICASSNPKNLPIKVVCVACLLMLMFVPLTTYGFSCTGISTLDAVYLCFQIYTTIGFGDVDLDTRDDVFSFFMMFWNTVGMVLLATIINAFVSCKQDKKGEMGLPGSDGINKDGMDHRLDKRDVQMVSFEEYES